MQPPVVGHADCLYRDPLLGAEKQPPLGWGTGAVYLHTAEHGFLNPDQASAQGASKGCSEQRSPGQWGAVILILQQRISFSFQVPKGVLDSALPLPQFGQPDPWPTLPGACWQLLLKATRAVAAGGSRANLGPDPTARPLLVLTVTS